MKKRNSLVCENCSRFEKQAAEMSSRSRSRKRKHAEEEEEQTQKQKQKLGLPLAGFVPFSLAFRLHFFMFLIRSC